VPDERWGQRVVAYVVAHDPADPPTPEELDGRRDAGTVARGAQPSTHRPRADAEPASDGVEDEALGHEPEDLELVLVQRRA
jgi:acyl-CoA synthetase (AMP-forming)/AMP-acid ligase II